MKFLKLKKLNTQKFEVIVKLEDELPEKDSRQVLTGMNLPTKWFPIKLSYNLPVEQFVIHDLLQ